MSDSSFVFFGVLELSLVAVATLVFCVKFPVVMCGRWFTLSVRLVLKGCLGSHRVSQLMRGDGKDRSISHRETDAVKTVRVPWQNTAGPSRANKSRSQQSGPEQPEFSSQKVFVFRQHQLYFRLKPGHKILVIISNCTEVSNSMFYCL